MFLRIKLNCKIFQLLLYNHFITGKVRFAIIMVSIVFVCFEFSSLYLEIMIISVFLIKLRDLLVFIAICLCN